MFLCRNKHKEPHRSTVNARRDMAVDAELDEKYPLLGIGKPVGTDKYRDKSG